MQKLPRVLFRRRRRAAQHPRQFLDPFLRFQAMHAPDGRRLKKSGGAKNVAASTGDEFSYSYAIDQAARKAAFEYTNHTQGTTFKMTGLTWVSATNSKTSSAPAGDYDTITFGGFGTWSKDGGKPHVATVQVSTSAQYPYVSILIDGGETSNVNTKPERLEDTMP